jgi:polysaccharide export outer membrane protein
MFRGASRCEECPVRILPSAWRTALFITALAAAAWTPSVFAEEPAGYALNPGDVLQVSVWKEAELTREVLVRPDGKISFPLVGDIMAAGRTPEDVQQTLVERLEKYVPDPSVTIALGAANGNKVYVLGKVARPGEYVMPRPLDVMQALAMAGGLNAFASENKVLILRRGPDGAQKAIPFRFGAVQNGEELPSNIMLTSGDVVVVP